MKIIGRKYDEVPNYYDFDDNHYWPYYTCIDEKEWSIDCDNIDDGEEWLINNYPEYYMGANILGDNGDFICTAVPGCEYEKGNYETIADRVYYVQNVMIRSKDRRMM